MIVLYGLSSAGTIALLVLLVLCGIMAITGSAVTFSFYKKKDKIVPFLYRIMAVFDILTGLNAIYFVVLAVTFLKNCNTGFYTVKQLNAWDLTADQMEVFLDEAKGCHRDEKILTPITFVITAVVTRVPMFVGVVLSLTRTINLAHPFLHIKKKIVSVLILLWIVVWLVLAVLSTQVKVRFDYAVYTAPGNDHHEPEHGWRRKRETTEEPTTAPAPLTTVTAGPTGTYKMADAFYRLLSNNSTPLGWPELLYWQYLLILIVSFVIPLAIMLVSTAVQLILICKSSGSSRDTTIQVTITVILITVLAIGCSLPAAIYIATGWKKADMGGTYAIDTTQLFIYVFGLPILNSAINPVILIARSGLLRKYVVDLVLCRPDDTSQGSMRTSAAAPRTSTAAPRASTAAPRASAAAPRASAAAPSDNP